MNPKKIKYLTNKDILREIHLSKISYSSYIDDRYKNYDYIITSLDDINDETIAEAKKNRAAKLAKIAHDEAVAAAGKKIPAKQFAIDSETISKYDLVFRLMTFNHIPEDLKRKKTKKTVADYHTKVNFPPYQHWAFDEDDELVCVGKSHWKGPIHGGEFCKDHGRMTELLGTMFIKLCDRYGTRGNVRGYTYNDEMRGQAILQLSQIGLQFDESKSNNPFAYYTAAVTNSFVRIINIEKRNQNIRDDIYEMNNINPSSTRQFNNEWDAMQENRTDKK